MSRTIERRVKAIEEHVTPSGPRTLVFIDGQAKPEGWEDAPQSTIRIHVCFKRSANAA